MISSQPMFLFLLLAKYDNAKLMFIFFSSDKLGAYNNAELIATLPDGMSLTDYKWVSVWCKVASVSNTYS